MEPPSDLTPTPPLTAPPTAPIIAAFAQLWQTLEQERHRFGAHYATLAWGRSAAAEAARDDLETLHLLQDRLIDMCKTWPALTPPQVDLKLWRKSRRGSYLMAAPPPDRTRSRRFRR